MCSGNDSSLHEAVDVVDIAAFGLFRCLAMWFTTQRASETAANASYDPVDVGQLLTARSVLSVGREPSADLCLTSTLFRDLVSRTHAKLRRGKVGSFEGVLVEDLGSVNGTWCDPPLDPAAALLSLCTSDAYAIVCPVRTQ